MRLTGSGNVPQAATFREGEKLAALNVDDAGKSLEVRPSQSVDLFAPPGADSPGRREDSFAPRPKSPVAEVRTPMRATGVSQHAAVAAASAAVDSEFGSFVGRPVSPEAKAAALAKFSSLAATEDLPEFIAYARLMYGDAIMIDQEWFLDCVDAHASLSPQRREEVKQLVLTLDAEDGNKDYLVNDNATLFEMLADSAPEQDAWFKQTTRYLNDMLADYRDKDRDGSTWRAQRVRASMARALLLWAPPTQEALVDIFKRAIALNVRVTPEAWRAARDKTFEALVDNQNERDNVFDLLKEKFPDGFSDCFDRGFSIILTMVRLPANERPLALDLIACLIQRHLYDPGYAESEVLAATVPQRQVRLQKLADPAVSDAELKQDLSQRFSEYFERVHCSEQG